MFEYRKSVLLWGLGLPLAVACSSSSTPGATGGDASAALDAEMNSDAAPDNAMSPGSTEGDGPSRCSGMVLQDGGVCPTTALSTGTILGPTFSTSGATTTFGTAPALWDVYSFASAGQGAPHVTASASTLSFSGSLSKTSSGSETVGVGLSLDGSQCSNAGNFFGLGFSLSGSLGGCRLFLDTVVSPDQSNVSDPCRGACNPATGPCIAPTWEVPDLSTNQTSFFGFAGGAPVHIPDTSKLIGFRWRLELPEDGGAGCSANVAIANLGFM